MGGRTRERGGAGSAISLRRRRRWAAVWPAARRWFRGPLSSSGSELTIH